MSDYLRSSLRSGARINSASRDDVLKNRLSPVHQKWDRIKAETQILALLTPEEARRWQEMQGEPFTFRTDRT